MASWRAMRSLERHALDSLVDQVLAQVGDARVLAPGDDVSVTDGAYVGTVRALVAEAFPGTPESLLHALDPGLVVLRRAEDEPSNAVGLTPSTLRVTKEYADGVDEMAERYGDLLNMTIKRSRYLDTDLNGPHLTLTDRFFAPRTVAGWRKLSRAFARLCESLHEVKQRSGLKQSEIFHEDRESHLLFARITDARGDELELA